MGWTCLVQGVEKERVGIALAATGFIVPNLP